MRGDAVYAIVYNAGRTTIRRVPTNGGAWTEVAAGTDTVRYTPTQPGAYRAEVRMMPNHARPYLAGLERLVRDVFSRA